MAKSALVIANSQYDDERFAVLPAAKADAEALARVLSDPAIGDFTVKQMIDVGQREATREIQRFFSAAVRDDLLVLHLSLHGWKDLQNRLYFVARDTERDFLEATAISAQFVSERMSLSRSRSIVLMLDCCYSGAFTAGMLRRSAEAPRVDVAEPFAGLGRMVMTASTSLQFAHEGEPDVLLSQNQAQPSLFTSAVVKGLEDGSADLDRDGRISVSELYEYVHEQVRRKIPGQTPTLSVDSAQGAIYIARRPGTADTDIPAELRAAITDPQAWVRVGALHRIEQLLGSVREPVRQAAQTALLGLIRDDDPEVAQRARELWHRRSLGDLPDTGQARRAHRGRVARSKFVAGIDFGTTNSAIGVFDNDDVRMIPNAEGALTTPSLVALTADGQTLVGTAAKRQAISNPEYTVASVKLKLGTDWSIERGGTRYSAEEIAALILARLRTDAEAYLGGRLSGAILTAPAYFGYAQRYALRKAAELAGITVFRIINEPTAASITYGLNRDGEQTALIIDLGGGTFDVSLIEVGENVCEVKATAGDNHLGGNDWDKQLVDHLVQLTQQRHSVEVSQDAEAMQRLMEAAESAKINLSSSTSTHIWLPYLAVAQSGPVHLNMTLTRAEFEAVTKGTLDRCKAPIRQVTKDSAITLSNITDVILVGGGTRMPAVADLVEELTGGKRPYRGLIPEGIVTGAALQAGVLTGELKDFLLLDVIPMSLGIETKGGIFSKVSERNTTIPHRRTELFTTARDNQESVTIHVLEGDQEIADYNSTLAVFELSGLAPRPKNLPSIEVHLDTDANGLLHIKATDNGSGRTKTIPINRDAVAEAAQLRQSRRWPSILDNLPTWRAERWIPAVVGQSSRDFGSYAGGVLTVAVTAGGKVAFGNDYGLVGLRDPDDANVLSRELGHHVGRVLAVAVTGLGKVVSGGEDGMIRLWNPDFTGAPSQELGHHKGGVLAVAVTGPGKVVSGGEDGVVRLWDPDAVGAPGLEMGHHIGSVRAVAVTERGNIVSGGDDGLVRLWDPGHPGRDLGGHVGSVRAVAVTERGNIVSGGDDGIVRLWDPDLARDPGRELGRHSSRVSAVAATGKGKIVSADYDGVVWLWDPNAAGDPGRKLGQHCGGITAMAITRKGKAAVIASGSGLDALTLIQLS
jgi:molecular chaperone DnaK